MEVIKAGFNPSLWSKEVKCSRCEGEYKISPIDISVMIEKQVALGRIRRINVAKMYVKCPNCGEKIGLNREEIPDLVQKKVFNNKPLLLFLKIIFH